MSPHSLTVQPVKQALVEGIEAALVIGDTATAEALLASVQSVPRGRRSAYLDAQWRRLSARMAGSDSADELFHAAAASFRELGLPFWLAVASTEHGEWLTAQDRDHEAEALLMDAREVFTQLGASPWEQRAAAGAAGERQPALAT